MTAVEDMKIRAMLPYFGGKRKLAPEIVRQLGPHAQYFEPFCGSLAVLFAKAPARAETVNDLHGDVTNLARVLQCSKAAPLLYERLQRTLVCEGLLKDAQAALEAEGGLTQLDRAYWYFVASWMSRNGTAGTDRFDYQIAVRWTANGGTPGVRFAATVESLPAWHRRLQNVVILSRDAFEITPRIEDAAHTVIYADPPYPLETRSNAGPTNNGGGGRYLHEFSHGVAGGLFGGTTDDHARLAQILRMFKATRIVVSSYDCERVRQLYAGWTFVPCGMRKILAAANARDRSATTEAPEVLIINGAAVEALE